MHYLLVPQQENMTPSMTKYLQGLTKKPQMKEINLTERLQCTELAVKVSLDVQILIIKPWALLLHPKRITLSNVKGFISWECK